MTCCGLEAASAWCQLVSERGVLFALCCAGGGGGVCLWNPGVEWGVHELQKYQA